MIYRQCTEKISSKEILKCLKLKVNSAERILRRGKGLVCLAKVRVGQVRGEERQISRVKANWRKRCFYLHLQARAPSHRRLYQVYQRESDALPFLASALTETCEAADRCLKLGNAIVVSVRRSFRWWEVEVQVTRWDFLPLTLPFLPRSVFPQKTPTDVARKQDLGNWV